MSIVRALQTVESKIIDESLKVASLSLGVYEARAALRCHRTASRKGHICESTNRVRKVSYLSGFASLCHGDSFAHSKATSMALLGSFYEI